MLTDSSIKTKSIDPFILSLVKNIGVKRCMLDNLESINTNNEFSNIQNSKKEVSFILRMNFIKQKDLGNYMLK